MSLILVCLVGALVGAVVSGKAWAHLAKRHEIQTTSNNSSQQQDAKPTDSKPDKKDEDKKKDQQPATAKKQDAKLPEKNSPPQAQPPTYSITNPSGSIINQGSQVDAPQTIINGPAPRQLTNTDALVTKLREIAQSSSEAPEVLILITTPDKESKAFRDALVEAFTKADWKVSFDNSQHNFSFNGEAFTQGVLCSGESKSTASAVADALETPGGIKCERNYVIAPSKHAFPVWLAIGKPE